MHALPHPGLIAWGANTLDSISGGRFVLGVGAGWHQPEFDAFGFEFDHRVSVFADSLEVLVPMLREGTVDYEGRWARGKAELRPTIGRTATRAGGPPILMAGSTPRMMSLIASWADRFNTVWYGLPTDEFREERDRLAEACAAIGRNPATIEVSVGIQVFNPRVVSENGPESIVGEAEHIADALAIWREAGVTEVMCRLEPPSTSVVEEIVRATELSGVRGSPLKPD